MSKKKHDEKSVVAEVERLKLELEAAENKYEERSSEIRGLKDTIRRECEERTELMIEVSELKDQIKRLTNRQGKSLRSESLGIDSSVQARQVFKNPESQSGREPGMLQKLTGTESSTLALAALGAGSSQNNENNDQDVNWSKQRQSAQQNNGKSKRKSKYRP